MISSRLHRRAAALLGAAAVAAGAAAAVAPSSRASAASTHSALHPAGTVTVARLHGSGGGPRTATPPAHPHKRSTAHTGGSAATAQSGASAAPAVPEVRVGAGTAGPRVLSSPSVEEQLQDFTGVSHDEQVSAFSGSPQGVTPPDTQIAVGPTSVVEAGNSTMLVMGKHGENRHLVDEYAFWSGLVKTADAGTAGSAYGVSDPRIVYDAASSRFYTTILVFDTNTDPAHNVNLSSPSYVGLAASDSSDPTGTWTTFFYKSPDYMLFDQPALGLTSDKLLLSWNEFDNQHPDTVCGNNNAAQVLVVDKGDVDTAAAAANPTATPATSGPQTYTQANGIESLIPAISESATTTGYLVYNNENFDCTNPDGYLAWSKIEVIEVVGRPHDTSGDTTVLHAPQPFTYTFNGGTVTWSAPPFAIQPGSNTPWLDDSDGRMQSVVFDNGVLAGAGAAAMQGAQRAVSGVLTFRIHIASPLASSSFDWGSLADPGNDIYDPALVLDGNTFGHFSYTTSGSQRYPSAGAFAFDWAGHVFDAGLIHTGTGSGVYDCNCWLFAPNPATGFPGVERWGDYSGIALDPSNPDDVWAGAEFATQNGGNWATALSRLTTSAPKLTAIDVTSDRTTGGATVHITGNDLDPASTAAVFGGVDSPSVQWVDPEHVIAVAPAHAAGTVDVQARTDDGASATSAADRFTYTTPPRSTGYWMVASDGGIFAFNAPFRGSMGGRPLNAPIVGMTPTADGQGYWMVASDGGIFAFGDAGFHGSMGGQRLNQPIVGMAATRDGGGYWLVAKDGGIFAFGDAGFYGSTGSIHLNQPIVGMAPAPDGFGYWLVASDGGIFAFGPDARFHGSAGNIRLNKPIVGMAATSTGGGYWLVATDGGIFSYGDAAFHGSTGNIRLNQPVVGMTSTGDDGGYWLVASDGGIFSYGDAQFHGSTGNIRLNQPIVGMASAPA